jgi:putative aminopeptidase FrvX
MADAPLCIFAAHMDEIGMVITRIHPDGSLAVARSGGLMPWKLGEGPVTIVGDRDEAEPVTGVLSFGSTHTAGDGADSHLTWADARILTGLTPAQLAEAGVRVGSTAVPPVDRRGPIVFGDPEDPLVAAWTFDDRLGCVAQLLLLERLAAEGIQPHHPTIVAFTIHEEGGGQGAKVLAQRERPETFISVDGSPIPPGADLALDGRPAMWSKDRLTHYDQRLLRVFQRAAADAGTQIQTAVYDSAASDASLLYYAGGAYRIACFGHVRENSHGFEVIRLSVLDNVVDTLVSFVRLWRGE